MRDDPFGFEEPARRRRHLGILAAVVGGGLALLALVLTIAVYALNVGTIWSSQAASGSSVTVRNESRSTLSILLVAESGLTRRVGRVAPGGVVVVPLSSRCSNGGLEAVDARGSTLGTRQRPCNGEEWTIG